MCNVKCCYKWETSLRYLVLEKFLPPFPGVNLCWTQMATVGKCNLYSFTLSWAYTGKNVCLYSVTFYFLIDFCISIIIITTITYFPCLSHALPFAIINDPMFSVFSKTSNNAENFIWESVECHKYSWVIPIKSLFWVLRALQQYKTEIPELLGLHWLSL